MKAKELNSYNNWKATGITFVIVSGMFIFIFFALITNFLGMANSNGLMKISECKNNSIIPYEPTTYYYQNLTDGSITNKTENEHIKGTALWRNISANSFKSSYSFQIRQINETIPTLLIMQNGTIEYMGRVLKTDKEVGKGLTQFLLNQSHFCDTRYIGVKE
jgi:hypothetical protein